MILLSKMWANQKLRFLTVGGFNTVFGYAMFSLDYFLLGKHIGYVGSLITSHLIASWVAYVLFTRVVFTTGSRGVVAYLRFQSAYVIPLLLNAICLPLLVATLMVNVYLAQAVFASGWTIASFFVHKYFSFRVGPDRSRANQ